MRRCLFFPLWHVPRLLGGRKLPKEILHRILNRLRARRLCWILFLVAESGDGLHWSWKWSGARQHNRPVFCLERLYLLKLCLHSNLDIPEQGGSNVHQGSPWSHCESIWVGCLPRTHQTCPLENNCGWLFTTHFRCIYQSWNKLGEVHLLNGRKCEEQIYGWRFESSIRGWFPRHRLLFTPAVTRLDNCRLFVFFSRPSLQRSQDAHCSLRPDQLINHSLTDILRIPANPIWITRISSDRQLQRNRFKTWKLERGTRIWKEQIACVLW